MDFGELRNLLLEKGGRLFLLCLGQAGAQRAIEARQASGDFPSPLHVERALQLRDHQEGMVDLAGAGFDIAPFEGEDGAAQIFDGLFVEDDDQPHRVGAAHAGFTVGGFCIHRL